MSQMTLMARMETIDNLGTMTIDQVADYLGVSTKTVRRRIEAGEIKPLPKPKGAIRNPKLLFLRSDVEKLVKE